jgi:TonB family protein
MSPRSLLFSSDEEASRLMVQALRELELEVDHCREIFAAVEKITGHSFEVIVADWDDGPEASFLLKTAHELKYNSGTFAIAIAGPGSSTEAAESGANLVLTKPLAREQIKTALFNCDEFLKHMRSWLGTAPGPLPHPAAARVPPDSAEAGDAADEGEVAPGAIEPAPVIVEPAMAQAAMPRGPALLPAGILVEGSGIQQLFYSAPVASHARRRTGAARAAMVPVAALGMALLSALYVAIHPARCDAVARSVISACGRAVESTRTWFDRTALVALQDPEVAQNQNGPSSARRHPARIRVIAPQDPDKPSPATTKAEVAPEPEGGSIESARPTASVSTGQIPESLKAPYGAAATHNPGGKTTSSLLSALEPADLSESLAETLLLQRVEPRYPDQAIKNRLQGPVVFQAWIGRDGKIVDIKLERGYLVLAHAAAQAIRQWRYRPYLLDGEAVEARTYVTVSFKLP